MIDCGLTTVCSGRASRAADAERSEARRKGVCMEQVVGIGGVFFKARDPKALAAWYREHLGVPVVVFIITVTAHGVSAQEKILFTDPFVDKLADGWSWVREDPKDWRLDKGTLVIRTSRGGLFMKDNNGRNIPLRTPPEVK